MAAGVGAAALVVVTALEHSARSSSSLSAAATPTEVVTTTPSPAATPSGSPTAVLEESSAPTASVTLSAPAAMVDGSIEISLVHGGTALPAVEPISGPLFGPLHVQVLGADGASVATVDVPVDQAGRIEGLAAGSYRLILTQQTPVTEPSAGVAISAASAQATGTIALEDGDVLLIAAHSNPVTTPTA